MNLKRLTALIELVKLAQRQEEAFRAQLSEAERNEVGTADQWSQKEVVAHLGYWKDRQAIRTEAITRGDEQSEGPDWGQLNTETWPAHAQLTWEESVDRSDQATRDLIAALQRVPPEVMANLGDESTPGNLLIATTLGNSLGHVAEHIANYYRGRGESERATRAQEEAVQAIIAADLGPGAEGSARYNLGCYYALHGQAADALAELKVAFARRPDLVVWARQDHDLDSLREDAEFQALVPPEDK
jgi:tetratricopeptide (TPR) repeat protein